MVVLRATETCQSKRHLGRSGEPSRTGPWRRCARGTYQRDVSKGVEVLGDRFGGSPIDFARFRSLVTEKNSTGSILVQHRSFLSAGSDPPVDDSRIEFVVFGQPNNQDQQVLAQGTSQSPTD